MSKPDEIVFFRRAFPSANMTLVRGPRPILIDTGFGSDWSETETLLYEVGVPPGDLSLVVNTHYHCDHVGGNHALQMRYRIPLATHFSEAELVNSRDREACSAEWLNQPVSHYTISRPLHDGDLLDTGAIQLQVIHTPGHTLGHISLYAPDQRALIVGDVYHADDVAWLNSFREGVGAIQRIMHTLDKLAALDLQWSGSGHGPDTGDPRTAIDTARRRYQKWLTDPHRVGWHACKRIFSYMLMLTDGMTRPEIDTYLLGSPWFLDYSRYVFETEPADFIQPLLDEMLRSGACSWQGDQLRPLLRPQTPYAPPPAGWWPRLHKPRMWPPA